MLAPAPVEVLPMDAAPGRSGALTPQDLGELLTAFNDVTGKLQRSHEKLHAEVGRLTRDLADANAQIERSRRLAALGEMAAGIAHEVRNPLGSIRLYARMLEQDLAPESEPQGVARKIARSVTVIEQIVGDVLSFAREHRVQRNATDLADVVERSIEACAPTAHPEWKKIAIRREWSGDGPTIEADAGLLQQALVNVIRNALEAMEEAASLAGASGSSMADARGPRMPVERMHALTISIEPRREVSGRPVDAVAVIVRDSGPGVTPEIVSRMFNPFFTTRGAGTGLGLSIVHRIVDAHGGSVRVRNNRDWPGASPDAPGASVELVLPRAGVAEAARASGVGSVRAADGVRA